MRLNLNKISVKLATVSALVAAVALTAGCGSNSELEKVRATAEAAQAAAQKAQSTADAAQSAAASAQQTADQAKSTADQAAQTAEEGKTCCSEVTEKLDRMFQKSMRK